ncbi:LuxR C-terminal-related transcriptional regulator [Streptacidiphilus sp. EB129]|uniref:helix-turn-helix transcriptional regulator n=1 Tax=Streptacidiphilus sp. EB129 TaxID=3156262 RepID=UPI003512FE95
MHDVLDPASDRGRVYRTLVAHPGAPAGELAALTGLSEATVQAVLADLRAERIVVTVRPSSDRLPSAWEALPPLRVLDTLLHRDAIRRADLRQAGAELDRIYRFAHTRDSGSYGALEILEGTADVLAAIRRLQAAARHQLRVIDVPPYSGNSDYYLEQEDIQRERMASGIVYRVIYAGEAYDDPVAGPNMARMIEAGEQARTLDEAPVKLLIGDEDLALLTLPADDHSVGIIALQIRSSSLLQALSNIFEALWRLAVPVSAAGIGSQIDTRDRQILTLMASGATDDAIARRLGLGRRTVVRRVAALHTRLGATTRFQAGVQAARRGWL